MDWRQQLLLTGVSKSAREFLAWLEAKPDSEPGYSDKFERVAREFCPGDLAGLTRLTFGLFHNPGRNVVGVVIVVSPSGMLILDAKDARVFQGFLWPALCRFDVKHDGEYQIVGFSWYDGVQDVAKRVELGTPLQSSEMSGGYMYLHADQELLAAVTIALDELGVPEAIHQSPPLL